jgi:hypothetical protein
MLATDGQLGWLGPAEEAPDRDPEVVDAGGTTAVAGMVAAHRHLTLPGGAPWIDRAADPTPRLLATAEDNARLLGRAGVRWARDVGAPLRDGRALSLTVRERWRGRPGYPCVRVAGGWLARTGSLPAGCRSRSTTGTGSWPPPSASSMPAPTWSSCPWTAPTATAPPFPADQVHQRVEAAHARGATVPAHSSPLPGARAAVAAGVDALEHGFRLDADLARVMAAAGDAPGGDPDGAGVLGQRRGDPAGPLRSAEGGRAGRAGRGDPCVGPTLAHGAGVLLGAGTDFGGGWLRPPAPLGGRDTLVAAGWSPMTPGRGHRQRRVAAGEPGAGVLADGARPTSCWSTATPCPTRGHGGGGDAPAGTPSALTAPQRPPAATCRAADRRRRQGSGRAIPANLPPMPETLPTGSAGHFADSPSVLCR